MKTKIFYDFEATSVSRDADCISVGLVAFGKSKETQYFYAEFTDFESKKCDNWVKQNIIGNLKLNELQRNTIIYPEILKFDNSYILFGDPIKVRGDSAFISKHLKEWLSNFEDIEFWADFDVIDKPMLIDLIADWDKNEWEDFDEFVSYHKVGLPKHLPNIKYDQFFDLHTLFKIVGIDTDIDREQFSKVKKYTTPIWFNELGKHNALYDAYVTIFCYGEIQEMLLSDKTQIKINL